MIFALNFFASIQLAEGLRPLLKKKRGNCVITSSNSITNMTVRMDWVDTVSYTHLDVYKRQLLVHGFILPLTIGKYLIYNMWRRWILYLIVGKCRHAA